MPAANTDQHSAEDPLTDLLPGADGALAAAALGPALAAPRAAVAAPRASPTATGTASAASTSRRMMGSPDDPTQAPLFRRGSPLYRAERIEAPLLVLRGRKGRRVVPLMTEKMVEAPEIEGKHHEADWYVDEGHGWQRRENRRDAFGRILAWLKAPRPRRAAEASRLTPRPGPAERPITRPVLRTPRPVPWTLRAA